MPNFNIQNYVNFIVTFYNNNERYSTLLKYLLFYLYDQQFNLKNLNYNINDLKDNDDVAVL